IRPFWWRCGRLRGCSSVTRCYVPKSKRWSKCSEVEAAMAEGWTAARVAELRRMIAGKLSFANIAVRLGITRNACIGKASRLKIAVPNKSEAAPPAVRRMVREAKRLRRAKARRSRSRCDEAATAWGQDQCGCAVSLRGALK